MRAAGEDGPPPPLSSAQSDPDNPEGSIPTGATELPPASRMTVLVSAAIAWTYVAAGGVATILGWTARLVRQDHFGFSTGRWWAIAFAALAIGAALLIVHKLGSSKNYGIFRPLVGGDNRYSTSLTQIGLWTVLVGTALAFLLGRVIFEDRLLAGVIDPERWEQYLLLLGGPFAAAVLAKGIVTYKLDNGTLQETRSDAAKVSQVFESDDESADLVDTQYLIFNVVAMAYFLFRFVNGLVLPEIPPVLLALTSATASLYVGNKAAQRNAPTITSMSPRTAKPGDSIVLHGLNFDPIGSAHRRGIITVTLTGHDRPIYPTSCDATEVVFVVPADAAVGPQTVTVTSTAGIETEPEDVKIVSAKPFVTTVDPAQLVRGQQATLRGRNLGRDGEAVRVTVGSIPVTGTPTAGGEELQFAVPEAAVDEDGLLALKVEYQNGEVIDDLKLPIAQTN